MMANAQTYNEVWQTCMNRIKEQTSNEEFSRWFEPITPIAFDGTKLRLRVPSVSYAKHIEQNYLEILRPIILQMFGRQTRLVYAVPNSEEKTPISANADMTAISQHVAQTNTQNIPLNPFAIPGLKKIKFPTQLNSKYTFSTHVEGECNRLARSAGMTVALQPGSSPFNPLYIYGASGLGKTHIVQAIGHEVCERHPELQVLYVSTNKFQAQFLTAYKNGEINEFINFYQMIDVLIVDDIQELSGNKVATQNAFFNIFNHLQLAGKQIILTSDKPPVELKDIEQRLLTRFKWGLSAMIDTPDYETKLKIIRSKSEMMGMTLPEEVVTYLADNISANIREIEGALLSLNANVSYMNRRVSTSLAKEVLKAYVHMSQKEISIGRITEIVCKYFDIDEQSFSSSKRTREVAQARQIAMYLAKQHTKLPLAAIGSAIGGRNHATVLHSCKNVTNLIETDKVVKNQIEEIEKLIIAG
ncbi:MAG: chromosomal replication initiator protein DnaA [Alistipes sp.]|nr:chromosomal replication initiator protein DnaA [Alistipes sp.]